ncbi:hypothetical protein DFH09DRAFT_1432178 [Mycena vulgaris]|nr:hypothetical protein DFH09DRAFT_1432178 [Mycena vulgaris]
MYVVKISGMRHDAGEARRKRERMLIIGWWRVRKFPGGKEGEGVDEGRVKDGGGGGGVLGRREEGERGQGYGEGEDDRERSEETALRSHITTSSGPVHSLPWSVPGGRGGVANNVPRSTPDERGAKEVADVVAAHERDLCLLDVYGPARGVHCDGVDIYDARAAVARARAAACDDNYTRRRRGAARGRPGEGVAGDSVVLVRAQQAPAQDKRRKRLCAADLESVEAKRVVLARRLRLQNRDHPVSPGAPLGPLRPRQIPGLIREAHESNNQRINETYALGRARAASRFDILMCGAGEQGEVLLLLANSAAGSRRQETLGAVIGSEHGEETKTGLSKGLRNSTSAMDLLCRHFAGALSWPPRAVSQAASYALLLGCRNVVGVACTSNAFLRVPDRLINGGVHVALLCAALALGICVARHRVRRGATERGRPKGSGTVVFETSKDAAAACTTGWTSTGGCLRFARIAAQASPAPAVSAAARAAISADTAAGCEICAAGTSTDTNPPRSRGDAAERRSEARTDGEEARGVGGTGSAHGEIPSAHTRGDAAGNVVSEARGGGARSVRGGFVSPYSQRCSGARRTQMGRKSAAWAVWGARTGRHRVPVLAAMCYGERAGRRCATVCGRGRPRRGAGGTGSAHGEASCPRTRGDALQDAAEGDRGVARAVRGACGEASYPRTHGNAAERRARMGRRSAAWAVRGARTGRRRVPVLPAMCYGMRWRATAARRGRCGEASYPRTRGDALLSASAALGGIGRYIATEFVRDGPRYPDDCVVHHQGGPLHGTTQCYTEGTPYYRTTALHSTAVVLRSAAQQPQGLLMQCGLDFPFLLNHVAEAECVARPIIENTVGMSKISHEDWTGLQRLVFNAKDTVIQGGGCWIREGLFLSVIQFSCPPNVFYDLGPANEAAALNMFQLTGHSADVMAAFAAMDRVVFNTGKTSLRQLLFSSAKSYCLKISFGPTVCSVIGNTERNTGNAGCIGEHVYRGSFREVDEADIRSLMAIV